MSSSRSRSSLPSSSGMVGSSSFALSGRTSRPFSPDAFSTVRSDCAFWLIGRCPRTSPVATKSSPSAAIISPARRIIAAWQSMHGFIAPPKPWGGDLTSEMMSAVKSTTRSFAPSAAAARRAASAEKNGLSNAMHSTSAPARSRTRTASWLSSPPLMSEKPRAPRPIRTCALGRAGRRSRRSPPPAPRKDPSLWRRRSRGSGTAG